ncbi:MAG TPA: ATP-grasp domain-containing protein [Solirubrobacterales bacterium]|nr:ATP-grasp domain-containing protein [Solirubrobacterales bacterium]
MLGEIDLVRALALGGVRSAVVARRSYPARYSRAAVPAFAWIDPWKQPNALVERLLEFGRAQPEPPVFYYDGDADLLLLSRHRARLREAFRFVVAEAELVETLVDKARFQALAEQLELPVPGAQRLSVVDEPPSAVDLTFPVVVKPLTRQGETWRPLTESKAIHVESPAALSLLWPRLAETVPEMLVQEVVPGPESSIESYHTYIDESGEIAGEFTGRKLRTYPRRYGYSTAVTITQSDEVTALGREISRRLGLRGVAKLDFKRGPDGRLRLLEINPRFNLWHHPGAIAGVNIPALVYSDLVGVPRPAPPRWRPGVRWCSLSSDLQAARSEGISPARWLGWALASEAKSGFAWDDPLPLPRAILWRFRRMARTRLLGVSDSADRAQATLVEPDAPGR